MPRFRRHGDYLVFLVRLLVLFSKVWILERAELLRYQYSHRTIFSIGQVDTHTLQAVDAVVISLVALCLGAHGGKAHAGCAPPIFSRLPFVQITLLPAPATPLGHPPARYNLKYQHSNAQRKASITWNVVQHIRGLILIDNEYDDDIVLS